MDFKFPHSVSQIISLYTIIMLSLNNDGKGGIPFARIAGGKLNDKFVFINPDSEKGKTVLEFGNDEILIPFPNHKTRDVCYVAGPSGVGKSTYCGQYMYNYKQLFPNNPMYVFSRLELDKAMKALGAVAVPINDELTKLDAIRDLRDCLCVFDDIDTIPEKKLKEKVHALSMDILETGRHNNIYILITSHLINGNDKKICRTYLNEAKSITVFPKGGNARAIRYVMKEYVGLDKKQIEEIIKLKSRWVTVHKNYPQFYFYEHGAKML